MRNKQGEKQSENSFQLESWVETERPQSSISKRPLQTRSKRGARFQVNLLVLSVTYQYK